MLTLGIETSCDETSVSVVKNSREILSNEISSSLELHAEIGGVVPEIASRAHLESINYVIKNALKKAKCSLKNINLIAVTAGPGLVGALLVGISMAKSLSFALNIPLIGVNHLYGHMYAAKMNNNIKFPFIGLLISGGHTLLIYAKDIDDWEIIGRTCDDAVGEAFDKVAKMLNLGYPGGPVIEKMALKIAENKKQAIKFPKAKLKNKLDFSFSGLKTAVLYYIKKYEQNDQHFINNVADSFQETAIDTLVEKSITACKEKKLNRLVVGGGVSINTRLREKLKLSAEKEKIKVFLPNNKLCMDNAAMIAGVGYCMYKKGITSGLDLTAFANLSI